MLPTMVLLALAFFVARARWGVEQIDHWFEKAEYFALYEVAVAQDPRALDQPTLKVRALVERSLDEVDDGLDEDGQQQMRRERATWLIGFRLPLGTRVRFLDDDCYITLHKNTFCLDDDGGQWLVRLTRTKLSSVKQQENRRAAEQGVEADEAR